MLLFTYEKYSISEDEFLSKLDEFLSESDFIDNNSLEKLVDLFRFILHSARLSNYRILYYYECYYSECNETVKHFKFIIEDKCIKELRDKFIAMQDFLSEMDLDLHLKLIDQKFADYSVEIFFYTDNSAKTRLVIDNYTYSLQCSKSFDKDHKDQIYLYSMIYQKSHKMFMYGNLQPYMDSQKHCFPMNIKYLFSMFNNRNFDMLGTILKWYSQFGIVFKDILSDYRRGCTDMPPFSFDEVMSSHNRRELLEIKLKKVKTCKKDNTIPLFQSYYVHKAEKYIRESDLQILYQLPFDIFHKLVKTGIENQRVKWMLQAYYEEVLYSDRKTSDDDSYIIRDYIDMSIQLKQKINLMISYKKLCSEHNRLALLYDSKRVRQFKIPDTTLSKLVMPKEYVRITGKKMLLHEAAIQHHCVASYADKISRGKCLIYTTIYQEKRYTIEIIFSRKKFVARQIRGVYNSLPPDSLPKELKKLLSAETARVNKLISSQSEGA